MMTGRSLFNALDSLWSIVAGEVIKVLFVVGLIILNIAIGWKAPWYIQVLFFGGEIVVYIKWAIWCNSLPPIPEERTFKSIRERNEWAEFEANERRRARKKTNRFPE